MNKRTNKKENAKPEAAPEAAEEQVNNQPEVEQPETEQLQVEQPEAGQPEASKPEAAPEADKKGKTKIAPEIDAILKLYPQYDKVYVTKEGFVHPGNAPEYQRKGAVLYANPYFNK